jgi:hypothetical protein
MSARAITPPLFLFTTPGLQPRTAPLPADVRFTTSRTMAPPVASRVPSLNAEARRALAELNDLGAALGENVTAVEARRAFRRLARRYHPDRHPGSDEHARAVLARRFAAVCDHYRVLLAEIDASH